MVELTISKSKVGPVTERYIGGSYKSVDPKNDAGVKRMAILGLDNSHNKDYKVSYASDALITIQGSTTTSHPELQSALESLGIWELAQFTPIEIPHGQEWKCGFKTTPEKTHLIELMYKKCKDAVDDHQLLGDVNTQPQQFTVYYE